MKNKYLLNSLIGIALLLVLFSFTGVIYEAKERGITGMAVSEDIPEYSIPEKIKAAMIYEYANESQRDTAAFAGINLMITQYGAPANLETKFEKTTESPDAGYSIKTFAKYANNKNIMFFAGIHFRSPLAGERVGVYYNRTNLMAKSRLIPPLDREYWAFVTEKIKNLAENATNPEYRIDGVFIDFEMYDFYNESSVYFSYNGSFDDETFFEFLGNKSLEKPDRDWTERHDWLSENNLLGEYYDFVKQKAEELARNLRDEIDSVNPDFLIGFYQSPHWSTEYNRYYRELFLDFAKGWGSEKPSILFATETFDGGGVKKLPKEWSRTGNYFTITRKDNGEKIKMYYAAGGLLSAYPPENFSQVLEIAQETNGYWLFSFIQLYRRCDWLSGSATEYRLPVNCENDLRNPGCCINRTNADDEYWKNECCKYWPQKVQDYWTAINLTNYQLYLEFECQETNSGIETCDSIDNDCDGQTDEGLNCNVQNCSQAGFTCRTSCFANETQTTHNCTGGVCCKPQIIEQTCTERGGIICASDKICNGTSISAGDGECCLGSCVIEIVLPEKTCSEQSGRICNSTQYCTGAIGSASDGECCLGECVEGSGITECKAKGNTCRETCLTNETELSYYCNVGVCCGEEEKPKSNWFYWFLGGIGAAIVGLIGYIIHKVNKIRY